MKQRRPKFDAVLAEAVQEGLRSVSPAIPGIVFLYLQDDGLIQSDNLIDNIEAFEEGLKTIFGFGAKVVEKKILEVLYIRLQIPRKPKDEFKFAEEVKNAQKLLDSFDLVTTETH